MNPSTSTSTASTTSRSSGPTGVGKSTVIDAICFALYGSVPRYGDERLTARVVSIGKQEAKVSLEFNVGDGRYRATRVVRVRAGKSSTPEAILERLDANGKVAQVLASSARELKPAVEKLLGLPFAHFTRCVVLPQGEFARFLHDEPAKRRDLLTRLLDLEVYDRIGQLARQHAAAAKQAVEIHERQRAGLPDATEPRAPRPSNARAALLELHHDLDAARPRDQEFVATIAEADARARRAAEIVAQLDAVAVPREVTKLTAGGRHGRGRRARSQRSGRGRAGRPCRARRSPGRAAGPRGTRTGARRAHERGPLATQLERLAAAEAETAAGSEQVADGRAARRRLICREAEQHARSRTRRPRRARAGRAPRCRRTVSGVPPGGRRSTEAEATGRARRRPRPRSSDARAIAANARAAIDQATRAHADAEAALRQVETQLAANAELTATFPDAGFVTGELARIDEVGHARTRPRAPGARSTRRGDRGRGATARAGATAADASLGVRVATRSLRAGRPGAAARRARPRRVVDGAEGVGDTVARRRAGRGRAAAKAADAGTRRARRGVRRAP